MDQEFRLPGSSFEEIGKIVQAYASFNRAVSLEDVSRHISIHPTVVSRNSRFLVSIGVLEGGKNKAVTPLGKRLGDALSHNIENEVALLLRQIIEGNEFLKNLVGAIRIRRGMDESALRAHVAYSAGQSKSPNVMTGTGAVVELLRRAGAIEEREGKLQATLIEASTPSANSAPSFELGGDVKVQSTPSGSVVWFPARSPNQKSASGPITLSIQVTVNCSPDQLDGLGKRLRAVIAEFNDLADIPPPETEAEDTQE